MNADGTLDPGFDAGLGANNTVYAVGLESSGKVIVGGDFTSINRTTRNRYARLNPDGSLDATFDPGRGANNTVFALLVLSDDSAIIAGDFTEVTGSPRNGVARIRGGDVLPLFVGASVSGGMSQLDLVCQPGRTYVLEASQDLITWIPITTNVAVNTTCQFTEPTAAGSPARFFRVRQVKP